MGYTGGTIPGPTYRRIGDHTEAVAIDFDPGVISYREILDVIWQSHDPRRNFGGNQYRHAIWYHTEEQKEEAERSRSRTARSLGIGEDRIATALEPAVEFTYAEDYHQKYVLRRQRDLIADLEKLFDDYLAFTDSPTMSRLNGWFGGISRKEIDRCREELLQFGLPPGLANTLCGRL